MKKTAQEPVSQYAQDGYNPASDQLGMYPGSEAQPIERNTPGWLLPVGLTAAGLTGYSLLRGAGRGLNALKARFLQGANATKPLANEIDDWTKWTAQKMKSDPRYESALYPGKPLGYVPEPVAKTASLDILRMLRRIANQ